MLKLFLILPLTILLSCSGQEGNTPADSGCNKLVDSLKHAIATRNDSIIKLNQVIDEQADSIFKLNGAIKADDYEENAAHNDSLDKK